MLGLNTLLIGELPRRKNGAELVAAALFAAGLGSFLLGLGFAVVAPYFSGRFAEISGSPEQALVFTAGVVLIGASLVFDQATIGLLRGKLQLWRNVIFSAAKLLILPVAVIVLPKQFGLGLTASWTAAAAVSLAILAMYLWLSGDFSFPRPDWAGLRGLGRLTMIHNWLNLAISVPWMLLPVLVTIVVSPAANGAFYAAWTLSGFLRIIPTHLATVLFAVAAADPQAIASKLRFSLRMSFMLGIPGMLALGLGAHLALGFFGASYAHTATMTLWLLTLGYLPAIPKVHYIAVCRATGHMKRAAIVLTSTATFEVAAAVIGAILGRLNGLSLALLAGFIVEGLATSPRVIRAASGHGRHRPMESGRGRHRMERTTNRDIVASAPLADISPLRGGNG
jgi:O-antigen/teichoic acid export membrane protein